MKRRDILKGLAVGSAALVLPSRGAQVREVAAWTSMSVRQKLVGRSPYRMALEVCPTDGKFSPGFEEAVEGWGAIYGEQLRAVGPVWFELFQGDGEPWLMHPSWGAGPMGMHLPHEPSWLYTASANVFRDHRWDLIDRAVNLREDAYWRQLQAEYPPITELCQVTWDTRYLALPEQSSVAYLDWCQEARSGLARIQVQFEAIPLADIEASSGGEYGRLEMELLALEDLRRAGKMTVRAYYKSRNERITRLTELEAAEAV